MKLLLTLVTTLLIMTGCSNKQYFEPEDTQSYHGKVSDLKGDIESFNRSGATLDNQQFISQQGVSDVLLPEGFEFINRSDNSFIATNNKDKVLIDDNLIEVGDVVVAATIQGNTLALLFSNNSIAIYDTASAKFVFKEYYKESVANDTRITNPLFMSNLILFPTLDGKVIVVSKEENKVLKNIVVDPGETFNNIIFLDVINDTLIAASNNKIIAVGTGSLNIKDYEIRDVTTNGKNIFLATIDGKLIKMDEKLNVLGTKKYKFAKFYALAYGTSLYALESQGFIVNVDDDFQTDRVYDFSFSEDAKTIAIKDTIYFGDEYIKVK
ncbi:MAG: hypothetical protein ACNI3C_02775 [Candidatus Marinarcus sp.]|uniref:hypothetical protein n=1 Tax=Candidatus Marinarcus sp. TaxID=3100987 RepID=UPI003B009AD0